MTSLKSPLKVAGIALIALLASACNTIDGAGQDIEAGGEAVSDAANEVEDDITD